MVSRRAWTTVTLGGGGGGGTGGLPAHPWARKRSRISFVQAAGSRVEEDTGVSMRNVPFDSYRDLEKTVSGEFGGVSGSSAHRS